MMVLGLIFLFAVVAGQTLRILSLRRLLHEAEEETRRLTAPISIHEGRASVTQLRRPLRIVRSDGTVAVRTRYGRRGR